MDDIQFLIDLQQELKTQVHDCQAAPRYWALMDYKWTPTEEGYHDKVSLFFINDCEAKDFEEYVDDLLKNNSDKEFTEEQTAELEELQEFESVDDVLKWIKENVDNDCYLVHEKEESFIVPNTMFLTKEEAKNHIKMNQHHYTSKVHTYAMTAWRAPKVERLLKILETFDWNKFTA